MSEAKQMKLGLINAEHKYIDEEFDHQNDGLTPQEKVQWNDFDYKQFGNQPKITLSSLSLLIAGPVLASAHIKVAELCSISIVQFLFVTSLIAFAINYLGIIRRYELMPFLKNQFFDAKLKKMCVLSVIALVLSIFLGWNGSGGILFGILWEKKRGSNTVITQIGYMLLIIIIGSLLMEENYSWMKLFEFIPGIIFGYVNSNLFTLKQSSTHAIAHQFLLLSTVVVPMLFPVSKIVSPSVLQWLVMIICGATLLLTVLFIIKLMQTERVSIVIAVLSGLMMVGTSHYHQAIDMIGAAVILVGIGILLKKKYLDLEC